MIKIKIVSSYLILGLLHCQSYCVSTLLSENDTKHIKAVLHSVSTSVYSSISDAITQQKSRSFLIANLRSDFKKQNLDKTQVDTIMSSIDQVITSKYYVQIIKSYKKAIGSGKMEDAVALINQVAKATEDSIRSFVESEINKLNEQENLKLTDEERQQIEDDLMEEESEVAKDGILEKLSKDKNFSNKFTSATIQSIQENVHIHMHSHSESHADSSTKLTGLSSIKSLSGQAGKLDTSGQLAIQSADLSKSLPLAGTPSTMDFELAKPVLPVVPTETLPKVSIIE